MCLPMGKNVALRQWCASAASTAGVLPGQGPSSKVSTTSPGFKKSCILKCSTPKPGPPVVSICTVREMPNASGLPGQGTACEAGGLVAAADTPVSGPRVSGAAVGAADSAAITLAAGVPAGVLAGLAGADVTEGETGSTFAIVDTGSAGGAGLGAMAGLGAGAFAATDVGGFKRSILVSRTAANAVTRTIMQATMMRIDPSGSSTRHRA